MNRNITYVAIMFEEIRDQNKVILELLGPITSLPAKVDQLTDDMREVKADIRTIKTVLTAQGQNLHSHTKQLASHDKRLVKLEAA